MPGRLSLLHAGPQGAAVAPPFAPTDLAGLQAWYQADVGLFTDAGTTPATTDGIGVYQWNDQSGNARHLTQPNAAKRPALKLAIRNGRNVVRADGVDDALVNAVTGLPGAAFTIFIAHQTTGDSVFACPISGNVQVRIGYPSATALTLYDGTNLPSSLASAAPRTQWTQAEFQSGSPPHFWVNGVTLDNGGTIGSIVCEYYLSLNNGALPVSGDVGEIIVYNRAVNSTERGQIESYLTTRWAL